MEITKEATIGEIVKDNSRTAKVFEHYGLDYCCGGNKKLEEACKDKGISIQKVISELRTAESAEEKEVRKFNRNDLDNIINHIVTYHHKYVRSSLPVIMQRLQIVSEKHGSKYQQLGETQKLFSKLGDELILHMMREEKILFPYIQRLTKAKRENSSIVHPVVGSFESVKIPIEAMEREHVNAGDLTGEIRNLCDNFIPPQDACQSFQSLYSELQEFELDLHTHIHLENNILFPAAVQLEEELKQNKPRLRKQ